MTTGGEAIAPTLERRTLSFATEADAAADVRQLRAGCRRAGNWSLAQTCHHLAGAIDRSLADRDPSAPVPIPDPNAKMYLDHVMASGQIPSGRPAPAVAIPPDHCTDAEVDRLLAALDRLSQFNGTEVLFGRFGVIPFEYARRFHLVHVAHHLSHLVPNG